MKNDIRQELTKYYQPIICHWVVRILYDLKGYSMMRVRYGLEDYERVLSLLGLQDLVERYEDDRLPRKKLRKSLKPLREKYDVLPEVSQLPLFKNTEALGNLIGLNSVEKSVLAFGVLLHTVREIEEAVEIMGDVASPLIPNILSTILGCERIEVRQALMSDSLLNRTGLVRIDRNSRSQLLYQFDIMEAISDVLLDNDHPDMMKALTRFFVTGKPSQLVKSDFQYLQTDYRLVHRYLEKVLSQEKPGANILIFGAPGTGKTELARTLALDLDSQLYEVTTDHHHYDGENTGKARTNAYLLCQQVLRRKQRVIILFDEIEDAFIRDGSLERFGIRSHTDSHKGKYNHILEANPIPAIWVSNVISHIDEAIIRRFDYVLELKTPPKSTRINILKKYTAHLPVREQWINQVASNEYLAPALISRAVKVVSLLDEKSPEQVEQQMERILKNTLNAMGYDRALSERRYPPTAYQLDVLNADYDLNDLTVALKSKTAAGCFCLYGPSGTGKSEFVRHMADQLDKTLISKRASDLLDPYVGMTERYISDMFAQAEDEDAVLLLDEADSFLRERTLSRESWEVTQVNELLTQMEVFKGLFFCTTNLMDNLDQASLRRFDLKIKLDYLKPAQGLQLFKQVLAEQNKNSAIDPQSLEDTLASWDKKVLALRGLTPGDFALVVRQNRFSPRPLDAETLFNGLEREVRFKQHGAFKGIGFIGQ